MRQPESVAHNAPVVVLVRGELDETRLARSLATLLERNEALRACFVEHGGEVLQFSRANVCAPFDITDLSSLHAVERQRQLYAAVRREVARPFDLSSGPLMRLALVRLAASECVLVVTLHHIVSDGWSQGVVLAELVGGYVGEERPAKAKRRFFEYADAQRAALDAGGHEASRRYWLKYAQGKHCVTLPVDRGVVRSQPGAGEKRFFTIDAHCSMRIRRFCAAASVSPFTVFLALFGVVIERRVRDAGDWCLPVSVGYRDDPRWLDVIGCFVEHLLVRPVADSRAPFEHYVRDIAAAWQQAFDHRDYPFDCLRAETAGAEQPLTPSLVFVYQNAASTLSMPGLDISPLTLPEAPAKFDLIAMVAEQAETFALSFEYDPIRYDAATIAGLGEQFVFACERLLEDPARSVDEVMLGIDAQCAPSIVVGERREWPDMSFAALFETIAARCTDREALRTDIGSISFRALRERVDALATPLSTWGSSGLRIGVHLDRSAELVVSVLAVLSAGHCYVPLSSSYPDARLAALVQDSAPALILTDLPGEQRLRALCPESEIWDVTGPLPSARSGEAGGRAHAPSAAAYLVYTSGSTGEPKGAYGLAGGLLNRLHWQWHSMPYADGDRALLRSPPMFVDSIVEMLAPLLGGACAVIVSDDDLRDPTCLWRVLARERITHLTVVPSFLEWLVSRRDPSAEVALKAVHCSGEPLSRALARSFAAALPGAALLNIYGSTEVTADATWHKIEDGEPSIGRPIANALVAIIDAQGNVLPRGVRGEIAVGGAPVGGGYRHAAAITAERYLPAPGGGRMFRTGDYGRIGPTGVCEYLGRLDLQVKVRGMRTNLLEIEEAIVACAGVREVCVALDERDGNRLVAFYTTDGSVSRSALASHARNALPAHAIPNRWIPVRTMPRTDSGKLHRAFSALEAQSMLAADVAAYELRDLSELERAVLDVWKDVLGDATIAPDDLFEQVGGHSLLAIRLVDTLNRRFGTSLRLVEFFSRPTVREQAAALAAQLAACRPAASPNEATATDAALVPDHAGRHLPFPLLTMQQAYRLGRDVNDRAAMSTICAFSMDYDLLSLPDFERALNRTIRRHDMLRAVLVRDDEDAQRILPEVPRYEIEQWDLSGYAQQARARELDRLYAGFAALRVEPGDWPSFRVGAAHLGGSRYRLFFAFDMVFIDLFSARLLMRELESIYRRDEARLAPIAISFRDYAVAIRAAERSDEFERAKGYWLARMDGLAEPPQLPVARRFARDAERYRFKRHSLRLPSAQWEGLQARAQARRVSPTSVLLAAYAATIGVWSGDRAFSLIVTTFNRLPLHPDVDKLVGDFTSSLVFGFERLVGETAQETCSRVQTQLREDLDHRAFGGVELLRELTRRNGGERIVLPVVFSSALGLPQVDPRTESRLIGQLVDSVTQTSHVWLDNQVEEAADGSLIVNWDAIDALFPPGLVEAMFTHYRQVLTALASGDDCWALELDVPGDPGGRCVDSAQGTAPPATLPDRVLEIAQHAPNDVAVIADGRTLTYAMLLELARRAAGALVALGVQPGARVGLLLEKGWEAPVAMLAVALSGAAYVPIDPDWPAERRASVATAAGLSAVIVQPRLAMLAPAGCPALLFDDAAIAKAQPLHACAAKPGDVAYLMFTSGTTGTPKGVAIEHRAAVSTIDAVNTLLGVTQQDRVLCVSSLCFDLSVYDVWGPLRRGAACVMPPGRSSERPWIWPALIETHRVTIWNSVPALMELLIDAAVRPAALATLRVALLSGDWIPLSMPERVRRLVPEIELISLGGATEASIWSIYFPIGTIDGDWVSIPYGRALPNQTVYVLDHRMRQCPPWATGDIYIGGAGLARGYWNAPELTAAQFVANPETGVRLYRTGDLGCYMPNEDIRLLGRRDGQVKLNGLRVELGEVESVLEVHPLVKHAVVRVESSRQLTACIVPAEPPSKDMSDLHDSVLRHARAILPTYMVPTSIDIAASLPLSANGKVDRGALAGRGLAPSRQHRAGASSDVIVEPLVAELWQMLLKAKQPRKQDNFFASGGDSLIATRFVAKLNAIFRLDLTARTIYDHPTLERLAEHVEACRNAHPEAIETVPLATGDDSAASFAAFALTDIQRSYHVGRRTDVILGAVVAQSYLEIDYRGLDLRRFEQAVNALIERHAMLRAVFPSDVEQQVLERVPHYAIAVEEIAGGSAAQQSDRLASKRSRLADAAYDPAKWPLFAIEATRFGDGVTRMHISLDIIIADAWSTNVIARDLLALYHGAGAALPELHFTFRDYVGYIAALQRTARYRRMRDYWQARLDTLPPPPALPVRRAHAASGAARFTRYAYTLDESRWTRLKERSLACGATPSAMLLTVFSRVLLLASRRPSFSLNITHFNRPSIHADINDIVGDFASTFLLECRHRDDEPLDAAIGKLCRQILSDLDHSQYSGVRVLQDLSQCRGRVALAPVVFTSALVLPVNSGASLGTDGLHGEVVYALTQTPQVWLDHQVYQEYGSLLLAWDVRDDVFDVDLVRVLFDLYVAALERLVDDAEAWRAPRLCVAPEHLARCREHLDRLETDPLFVYGDEHEADVDAALAKLAAHSEVAQVRAERIDAAGLRTIRVTLAQDLPTRWADETEATSDVNAIPPIAVERLELKRAWMIAEGTSAPGPSLSEPTDPARSAYLARRSHRRFWGTRIESAALVRLFEAADAMPPASEGLSQLRAFDVLGWIGSLAALRIDALPLPKFAYSSAGSCYRVHAYLCMPTGSASAELPAGWYLLDPVARRLTRCSGEYPQWVSEAQAPCVLLAADLAAIEQLYGERARAFAQFEAGGMIEVLGAASRPLGYTVRTRVFDGCPRFAGHAPIAALGLERNTLAGPWRDAQYRVRARLYRREGAWKCVGTWSGGRWTAGDATAIGDAFALADRHVLFELAIEPAENMPIDESDARLAIGAFAQRLMNAAPGQNMGLCILGYTPPAFAGQEQAAVRCFVAGGPLDQRQVDVEQGDVRGERALARTVLGEYAHAELAYARARLVIDGADTGLADEGDDAPASSEVEDTPVDLIDAAVRDIWQDVLRVPRVSGRANFFRLGGTSIDALSILRRLHDRYFIELRLQDVLADPTVDAMADRLRANARWSATIHEVHALLAASRDADVRPRAMS
ncbi:nonribosomal peptide synthetase protein BlmIV [Paraburkholderia caledonica]|uniref:Nonribosomal peptide synthetase protein BlmIV n=2 Tax=Paraburkholderia caledonica TaxID=134536 RepID=A0AB73IHX4_9BURK|nr:nonribosomal peptide synthetase protein BlmIV [Paraburkholderia caledonica]